MLSTMLLFPLADQTICACAVVRVNNSRSIWEDMDPHRYGTILQY